MMKREFEPEFMPLTTMLVNFKFIVLIIMTNAIFGVQKYKQLLYMDFISNIFAKLSY